MPEDAPKNKIEKTKANGAEVVLYKRHIESREQIALIISGKRFSFSKPFDNPYIIAGQAVLVLKLVNILMNMK